MDWVGTGEVLPTPGPQQPLSDDQLRALKSLGYVQ